MYYKGGVDSLQVVSLGVHQLCTERGIEREIWGLPMYYKGGVDPLQVVSLGVHQLCTERGIEREIWGLPMYYKGGVDPLQVVSLGVHQLQNVEYRGRYVDSPCIREELTHFR